MPFSIRKVGKKLQVYNTSTGEIHSKGTTKKKAEGQLQILNTAHLEGGGSILGNIKRAFSSTWNQQPQSKAEKDALNFTLNTAEPALIKPLSVLAPPVGKIAEAQRKLLASKYGMGRRMRTVYGGAKRSKTSASERVLNDRLLMRHINRYIYPGVDNIQEQVMTNRELRSNINS